MLKLRLKRIARRDTYTVGRLFVQNARFCDTIEDKDRGLRQDMTPEEIAAAKVYGKTAIPAGTYVIEFTYSAKFGPRYDYAAGDLMPTIMNVPGFDRILIHSGNTAEDTAGCLIVGVNKEVGKVLESRATLARLYPILRAAWDAGERIEITIE